jgi:hypothetical protein
LIDALLRTKPTYTESVATKQGWADATTGELLVAIKDLDTKIKVRRKPGRPPTKVVTE